MRDGQPIFDADGHVMEPPELWRTYIDPAFRDELVPDPRLGEPHGSLLPLAGGNPTFAGSEMMTEYLRSGAATQMLHDRFGALADQGFSPPATCRAMDDEGIDVAAVYPSFGLHVPYCQALDPPLATALARAYNRWIGEYCRDADGRVVPVALAPLHDPEAAADEIHRAARDEGARAVMLRPNPIHGRPLHHADNDVVFRAIEELDVAAIVHEGRGGNVDFVGADRFDTWYASRAACHPMEGMLAFAGLVVEGIFDRFPRLRVGFLESGTGWLPYWLDRLDEHHEMWAAGERPDLKLRPSEYFARHCAISGETDDRFIDSVVDFVGADHVVWASDFPHMECQWPDSLEGFLKSTKLRPEQLRQVLWETPARLYGIDASQ